MKLMVFLYVFSSATQYYLLFFTLNFYGLSYVSLSLSLFQSSTGLNFVYPYFDLHILDINTDYFDYPHFLFRLLIYFLFYSSLRDWPAALHRPQELLLDHNARFEFITVL
jgi:hypothetical protein